MLVRGRVNDLVASRNTAGREIEPEFQLKDASLETGEVDLVEALVAPHSRLAGATLRQLDFHGRYKVIVLAIQRRGQVIPEKLAEVPLQYGDALLLMGPKAELARLRGDENFIVLQAHTEIPWHTRRVPLALAIVAAVALLAALNVQPILVTAWVGCGAMVLTGCLRMEYAYRTLDWRVLILLAGVLPLGLALEKCGAAQAVADAALQRLRDAGPVAVLAVLYLLTGVLTECMSNNAAAALLAPVAISTAEALGVSAKPFLVAVTFAASTSFATPVGYQTNTMIYNAGGYRFADFLKVGVPLNLIFWALSVYLIPRIWPF